MVMVFLGVWILFGDRLVEGFVVLFDGVWIVVVFLVDEVLCDVVVCCFEGGVFVFGFIDV